MLLPVEEGQIAPGDWGDDRLTNIQGADTLVSSHQTESGWAEMGNSGLNLRPKPRNTKPAAAEYHYSIRLVERKL
jgi:hypothetical protein